MLKNEKLKEMLTDYEKRCRFLIDNYKLNIDAYFEAIDDFNLMTVVDAIISECERDKSILLKWFNEQTDSVIKSEEYSFEDTDIYGSEMHDAYILTRTRLVSEKQRYLQRFVVGLSNKGW